MTIVYFDSSAFVKLLVDEDGSDLAAALWDGCAAAVSSRLAYPEVKAALAAAGRAGRLDPDGQRRAEIAWEELWSSTRAVELTEAITRRAGGLAGERALRGADALHLASALAFGRAQVLVAVWDLRLHAGARAAGPPWLPPAIPDPVPPDAIGRGRWRSDALARLSRADVCRVVADARAAGGSARGRRGGRLDAAATRAAPPPRHRLPHGGGPPERTWDSDER